MKSLNWFNNNTTGAAKLVINVNFQFYTSRRERQDWKEIKSNGWKLSSDLVRNAPEPGHHVHGKMDISRRRKHPRHCQRFFPIWAQTNVKKNEIFVFQNVHDTLMYLSQNNTPVIQRTENDWNFVSAKLLNWNIFYQYHWRFIAF